MKICPNCQSTAEDAAAFCTSCGFAFNGQPTPPFPSAPQQPYTPPQPVYTPVPDPYDHTHRFDAEDISANKVFCLLMYLGDVFGVIIALLAAKDSPYVQFHVRQALRFTVVELLLALLIVFLLFTIVVPLAGSIALMVVTILKFVCFVQVCGGKAIEPAIIRDLKFLK